MSVVDGATHTQKGDVESNGGSLENVAEIFVLFLCGIQLVLGSGVLTVLDLDEVDVTSSSAEVYGRCCMSGVGGSAVAGGAAGLQLRNSVDELVVFLDLAVQCPQVKGRQRHMHHGGEALRVGQH